MFLEPKQNTISEQSYFTYGIQRINIYSLKPTRYTLDMGLKNNISIKMNDKNVQNMALNKMR